MQAIQAIRGFNDILPEKTPDWSFLENAIRSLAMQYAYEEIRLPLLEKKELFVRGVGEITDIVEKEMYCFEDRNGDHLCLRPEGTAGCVRAVLEHGLNYHQIQRLWYMGPMFRHERPQAGRYRQFYHVGFEAVGVADVYVDAELILMTARLFEKLGLMPHLQLQINTLGTPDSRKKYTHALVEYFTKNSALLDEDSQKRLHKNPLRILDSKNPAMAECIAAAPFFTDYLDEESRRYFDTLQVLLKENKVAFEINPRLVRGLDYYTHAVFEWTTTQLGAQATVCAGGRYDGLFEQLGGKPTPAVGWALGVERLLLLLEKNALLPKAPAPWIYLISVGAKAKAKALGLGEQLRNHFVAPILQDTSDASFKSQIKRADKSQAELALIIGEDELKTGTISVKFLRQDRPQQSLASDALVSFLNEEYQKVYGA